MRYVELINEAQWTEADAEDARLFSAYLKKKGIDTTDLVRMDDAEKEQLRADARANRHQYPIPVTEPDFLYHGTAKARMPAILRDGLVPAQRSRWTRDVFIGDWSVGKILFTSTIGRAEFYASQASKSRPVILRVPRVELADAVPDPKETEGNYYIERPVPPTVIEYWNGRKWVRMKP
jgi:hypothetical protein